MAFGYPSGLPDIFAGIQGLPGYPQPQDPQMPQDEGLGFTLADFLPPEASQQIPNVAPQSRGDAILALLGHAAQNANLQPRGFGQGLISGILGGLGGEGLRRESERAKLEAAQKQRQQTKDMANLEASRAYRNARVSAITARGKQHLVTAADAAATPALARLVGQNVSQSFYDEQSVKRPEETQAEKNARIRGEHQAMAAGTAAGTQAALGGAGEAVMSPRALNARVAMFRAGGPEPSFGMGKAGVANRVAFNEELAKQLEAEGVTGADVMAGRATQAADKASLTNLTRQLGTVNAAEETVKNNTKILLSTIDKVPDTGIPFLNQFARPGMEKVFGSTDVTNFNTALGTVQKEFARILNSGTAGGSALTEGARHDLEASLGKNFTKAQLRGALKILDLDAKNRTESLQNEINSTKDRLSQIGIKAKPGTTQSRTPVVTPSSKYQPGGFFDSNRPGGTR